MDLTETNDPIQIKINMLNPKEPPASSKARNQELKDMNVLCNKMKNIDVPKNSDYIQLKIKMTNPTNPNQEPPAFSKVPYQDFKDRDFHCTLKIKIETQILDREWIKDRGPYPDHDQVVNGQLETSSILESPTSGHKWLNWTTWMFFAPTKSFWKEKFGTLVYKRPFLTSILEHGRILGFSEQN